MQTLEEVLSSLVAGLPDLHWKIKQYAEEDGNLDVYAGLAPLVAFGSTSTHAQAELDHQERMRRLRVTARRRVSLMRDHPAAPPVRPRLVHPRRKYGFLWTAPAPTDSGW